jgi:hypothetical protein
MILVINIILRKDPNTNHWGFPYIKFRDKLSCFFGKICVIVHLVDRGSFDIGPSPQHPQYQLWHIPHTGHRGGFEEDVSFTDFDTTHAYYQILIDVCKRVSGGKDPWVWEVPHRRRYSGHIHAYFCKDDERNWP